MFDADVVIAGAGPAGCGTALHLASHGHTAIVIDRASFPRDKVCGEGLMPHGVEELDRLGLRDRVAKAGLPFTGIAYHVGHHSAIGRFPSQQPAGIGTRRLRLDGILHGACSEAGIEMRRGRFQNAHYDERGVTLDTDSGAIRARALVVADGARSGLRRKLGLDAARDDPKPRYGLRRHFLMPTGHLDRDVVDVYVAPDCEFYLTPVGPGEVNVAILCERDITRRFSGALDDGFMSLVEGFRPLSDFLEGARPLNPAGLTGPLRQAASATVADRTLLVGDAAGFVDAITGEGISISLLSARIAAEVLSDSLTKNRLSVADLRPYATRQRRVSRDLTWMTEIVLWGIRHPRLAEHAVGNLARSPELFGELLAVNSGFAGLTSIGLRGLWRLLGH